MADITSRSINELLLEIRYSPNAKILDYRGTWAETVSKHMELSEWQIQENRFDVYDKQDTKRFFVSYRNAGGLIRNSTTRNYFSDQINFCVTSLIKNPLVALYLLRDSVFVEGLGLLLTVHTRIYYNVTLQNILLSIQTPKN